MIALECSKCREIAFDGLCCLEIAFRGYFLLLMSLNISKWEVAFANVSALQKQIFKPMKRIIKEEELTVPQGVFASVASVLLENEMRFALSQADDTDGEESITLKVFYEKSDRDSFHQIQDLISDYEDESEEGGDEKKKKTGVGWW